MLRMQYIKWQAGSIDLKTEHRVIGLISTVTVKILNHVVITLAYE